MVIEPTPNYTRAIESNRKFITENDELREKLKNIELLVLQLNKEIATLKKENNKLQEIQNSQKPDIQDNAKDSRNKGEQQYFTDEEELERETEWVLKKKRPSKKRKAETSPEIMQTSNVETSNHNEKKKVRPKERSPLPINIISITTITVPLYII